MSRKAHYSPLSYRMQAGRETGVCPGCSSISAAHGGAGLRRPRGPRSGAPLLCGPCGLLPHPALRCAEPLRSRQEVSQRAQSSRLLAIRAHRDQALLLCTCQAPAPVQMPGRRHLQSLFSNLQQIFNLSSSRSAAQSVLFPCRHHARKRSSGRRDCLSLRPRDMASPLRPCHTTLKPW
jgi:hypothetical protein